MKYGFTRTVPLSYDRAVERVTEELKKEGTTVVGAFDPMTMVPLVEKPGLEPIAREVRKKLETALAAL